MARAGYGLAGRRMPHIAKVGERLFKKGGEFADGRYSYGIQALRYVFLLVAAQNRGRNPDRPCFRHSCTGQHCFFLTTAGMPIAGTRAGMSPSTTAPAPTVDHSPTEQPGVTEAPVPTNAPSQTPPDPATAPPG